MLLAPSPRNANFVINGSSVTGKHFPFAYSRKTHYGTFCIVQRMTKIYVVLSAVYVKHKGAQPFLYSGPELSIFRGQPMGVSSGFRFSGNF